MSKHTWQFAPGFRSKAFGWKSDIPIQRIREALSEIKLVAKKEPVIAAEGAIVLLEKLSPALEQVDSSSGAIGSAVNRAIETVVPIIVRAKVDTAVRQRWLERLWKAFEDDGIPYIELLGDFWGELCVEPELASHWADQLVPAVESIWGHATPGHRFYKGSTACMASLLAAGRHEELLALLEKAPFKWWHDRRWGVKALVAQGKPTEALRYAKQSLGKNDPHGQIAQACEAILLTTGQLDEAYSLYALEANQVTTHLATFRSIVKKYPNKTAKVILLDLIKSTPDSQGKWFAAAKDAGLFDVAIELVEHSPTDPRTLARAARDFAVSQPGFAIACGMASLRWIAHGHGYDITGSDVLDAYMALMQAASQAGIEPQQVKTQVRTLITQNPANDKFMTSILGRHLAG